MTWYGPSHDNHRFTARTDWFQEETVGEGIHRVTERWYREDYRCNIYLIRDGARDILIDTGLGLASLREYLRPLSPDPLLVSSHSHYDHIGGNFEFAERLIHPGGGRVRRRPDAREHLRHSAAGHGRLPRAALGGLPGRGLDTGTGPPTGLLVRATRWTWVAAASPSCTRRVTPGGPLPLGRRDRRSVLRGHGLRGELFDFLPCSDIPTYVQTLRRLREYPVRVAYPGHGPVLSGDEFRAVIDTYLAAHPV